MYYRPTKIDFENLKFLIMSAPVDSIMKQTVKVTLTIIIEQDLKHYNCDILVRTCERTYNEQMILEEGIQIIELEFPDGNSPPKAVIKQWLKIIEAHQKNQFSSQKQQGRLIHSSNDDENASGKNPKGEMEISHKKDERRIGIHCLAGLGRY